MKICIKNPAPDDQTKPRWGDLHFGNALIGSFKKLNVDTVQDLWPHWLTDHEEDVVVVLRGLRRFRPKPGKFNILWIVSHPMDVRKEELDLYDLILTASETHRILISKLTNKPVHLARQCTDTNSFFPPPQQFGEQYLTRKGVIYIANSRDQRRDMARWVHNTKIDVEIYGRNWNKFNMSSWVKSEYFPNRKLPELYRAARIGLNDHWHDMRTFGFVNNRIFDYLACGTPVLTDSFPEIKSLLGNAVLYVENQRDFLQKIEFCEANYIELLERVNQKWTELSPYYSFHSRAADIVQLIESPKTSTDTKYSLGISQNFKSYVNQILRCNLELQNDYMNDMENIYAAINKEHTQLNKEHTRLNEKHTQLNKEHTQLNKEHTRLCGKLLQTERVIQKHLLTNNSLQTELILLKHELEKHKDYIHLVNNSWQINTTQLRSLFLSNSWKLTKPLRALSRIVFQLRHGYAQGKFQISELPITDLNSIQHTDPDKPLTVNTRKNYRDITVSVIMTSYNSSAYIEKSISSLLDQTHKNIELIIVDDNSDDQTIEIIEKFMLKDSRIKLIKNHRNRGTYWAKNYGILFSSADVITTQDSDDYSDPRRIELQLKCMMDPGSEVSLCNYVRVNAQGEKILNRGVYERTAIMGMMIRKRVFEYLGYFDSVRFAADSEMYERIIRFLTKDNIEQVNQPLYFALHRDDSLTNKASKIDIKHIEDKSKKEDLSFLSPIRQDYVHQYRKWHESVTGCFMPFPCFSRPFEVASELTRNLSLKNRKVVALMASFTQRIELLDRTVLAILPQVDELHIYLNDFEEIPAFLVHEKINITLGRHAQGDLRDNGKFYFLNHLKPGDLVFIIDDDLNYPPDYISKLAAKILLYDEQAVIGVHGVVFHENLEKFFKDRDVYDFRHEQKQDKFVNLLGTGTIAFAKSLLDIDLMDFSTKGMADLWFAIYCKNNQIPLISIERTKNWLSEQSNQTPSLWDEFRENDNVHTNIARQNQPWPVTKI